MPKTKATKTKATKKTKTTPAVAPVAAVEPVAVEPVAVVEPVVEPVADPVETSSTDESTEPSQFDYADDISALQSELKGAAVVIKSLLAKVNALEKRSSKDRKFVEKKLRSRPKKSGPPAMNGFSKPGPVSDELRTFLGLTSEDLIARTEVTKKITAYCQEHKLQNEADKRIILADAPLRKLLRLNKADQLTYFNLQKYMKVHFPNKEGVYPTL